MRSADVLVGGNGVAQKLLLVTPATQGTLECLRPRVEASLRLSRETFSWKAKEE